MKFIADVSKIDGPRYVSPAERIAVFDNDGTLWCERPLQCRNYFAIDQLTRAARERPSPLYEHPSFQVLLEHNLKAVAELADRGELEPLLAAQAALTAEQFERATKLWLWTARHPTLRRPFKECAYLPQLELLRHLRNSGFAIHVVADGCADFVRGLAADLYSIPSANVIEGGVRTRLGWDGDATLPRPILAVGNSDRDLPMFRHTLSGAGRRLALLLHHDDKTREFAYDRDFRQSPLETALACAEEEGLIVVSMKRDWKRIFRAPAFGAPGASYMARALDQGPMEPSTAAPL